MARWQLLALLTLLGTYVGLITWFFRTIVIITPQDRQAAQHDSDPHPYDHESSWH